VPDDLVYIFVGVSGVSSSRLLGCFIRLEGDLSGMSFVGGFLEGVLLRAAFLTATFDFYFLLVFLITFLTLVVRASFFFKSLDLFWDAFLATAFFL